MNESKGKRGHIYIPDANKTALTRMAVGITFMLCNYISNICFMISRFFPFSQKTRPPSGLTTGSVQNRRTTFRLQSTRDPLFRRKIHPDQVSTAIYNRLTEDCSLSTPEA